MTITDAGGLTATSSVGVTVAQTMTSIAVAPQSTNLSSSGTQPFAATALDQFGNALATQPAFTWSVVGAGTIDSNGNYAPPYTAGSATVAATAGATTGTYAVTFPGSAQWTANAGGTWDSGTVWSAASQAGLAEPGLRNVAGDTVVFDTSAGDRGPQRRRSQPGGHRFHWQRQRYDCPGHRGDAATGQRRQPGDADGSRGLRYDRRAAGLAEQRPGSPGGRQPIDHFRQYQRRGPSAITVDGAGTVVLSGSNSYSGGTTVSAGTLLVTQSDAIAAGTSLTIGAGAASLFSSAPIAASVDTSAAIPAVASVAASSKVSAATAVPSTAVPASPPGPQASVLAKPVPAAALPTPAIEPSVWPSIAKGGTADLAWLGPAANAWDNSDQHPAKDVALLALEAVFAQYGR